MEPFTSIPVIDVGPILKTNSNPNMLNDPRVSYLVEQLDEACRNVGFFYVKGHDVSTELVEEVLKVGHEFFDLPEEEKLRIGIKRPISYRGYQKIGENITKGVADLHEAIDYYREYDQDLPSGMRHSLLTHPNSWPDLPERFEPVMKKYLEQVKDLARKILQGIALALGGSWDTFEGERAGDPFWILRVIGYPPLKEKVMEVGCGEHTDYGLLTLISQDNDVAALEVKNQAGEWVWVNPIPGTFVVNIGDMLKIWSNGLYESTLHRVRNDKAKYRVSVPFFYEPNFDAIVEPLDFCMAVTGGEPVSPPVLYGNYVERKVLTNFA